MIGGDWTKVEAMNEGGSRLPAGGYVIRIRSVLNVVMKEYLTIEYDIAEGEYIGYYAALNERAHFWGGHFIRSYKKKAAGFFKSFLNAVEASNDNCVIATAEGVDENRLIGKALGVVLGEEEYQGNDGSVKKRLYVAAVLPADRIRSGDFTVPAFKKLESMNTPPTSGVIDTTVAVPSPESFAALEEDVPF